MTESKTVNRGWLKRKVKAGIVEGKCNYSYTDDYALDSANNLGRTGWMPVRFSTGYGDFVEGVLNLTNFEFRAKSGGAYQQEDGTIRLYTGCDSYTLRVKG